MFRELGVELKRSTAFHPQTDGATERANRTLIESLRAFVDADQTNWDTLLPQLQNSVNDSKNETTKQSPWMMRFGQERSAPLDDELRDAGVDEPRGLHPAAQERLAARDAAVESARASIEKAQAKQRADSMPGRREAVIQAGDLVLLSNKNLASTSPGVRKLGPQFLGPYKVLEMRGSNAARLELPDTARINPTFNLDLLRKFVEGDDFPERPKRFDRPGPELREDDEARGPRE